MQSSVFIDARAKSKKMYIFGGMAESAILGDLFSYDFEKNVWHSEKVKTGSKYMKGGRYGHTSVMLNDRIYVFGVSLKSNGKGTLKEQAIQHNQVQIRQSCLGQGSYL